MFGETSDYAKNQSGRSMIEMLGVLAVIGVLSIGALTGYSAAMRKYRINQAVDEVKNYILAIKDFYAGQKDYTGISPGLLKQAGIFTRLDSTGDPENVFGRPLEVNATVSDGFDVFSMQYSIPDEATCQMIITAGWWDELGPYIRRLNIYTPDGNVYIRWGSGTYQFPITLNEAVTVCAGVERLAFNVR